MRRIKKVCLDLDDTLIPNSFRYSEPTWKCGLIITQALGINGPYANELMKVQLETDRALVEKHGFAAMRFPQSWVLTYEEFCRRSDVTPDPKVVQKLLRTAERFKFGPFRTFEGVTDTLEHLGAKYELHLVTAGDLRLQQRKIEQCGVGPLFHEQHIVEKDKRAVLEAVAGDEPSCCVMVGDSKRSDITPAIELGMHAVWIPSNTWDYAHADVDESAYRTIRSVTQLPAVLDELSESRTRKAARSGARRGRTVDA